MYICPILWWVKKIRSSYLTIPIKTLIKPEKMSCQREPLVSASFMIFRFIVIQFHFSLVHTWNDTRFIFKLDAIFGGSCVSTLIQRERERERERAYVYLPINLLRTHTPKNTKSHTDSPTISHSHIHTYVLILPPLSLSLSHTHTHTHTHSLSLSLSHYLSLYLSIYLSISYKY